MAVGFRGMLRPGEIAKLEIGDVKWVESGWRGWRTKEGHKARKSHCQLIGRDQRFVQSICLRNIGIEFESEDEDKAERQIVRKSRFAMKNWVVGFQRKEKMRKLAQIIIRAIIIWLKMIKTDQRLNRFPHLPKNPS